MKFAFLAAFLALPVVAQPPVIYGKLTVSLPAVTKKMAGKSAKAIMLGNLNVCATSTVSESVTDLKIHISSANFLSESDAIGIITASYNNQMPQQLIRDATLAGGAIGAAAALRAGFTSLPVIGGILAGVSFLQTEVGPMLLANQAPLASILANQLAGMGTNGVVQLGPQNCISNARVFVTMAPKIATPYIENFSFMPGTAPTTPMLHAGNGSILTQGSSWNVATDGTIRTDVGGATVVRPQGSAPTPERLRLANGPVTNSNLDNELRITNEDVTAVNLPQSNSNPIFNTVGVAPAPPAFASADEVRALHEEVQLLHQEIRLLIKAQGEKK